MENAAISKSVASEQPYKAWLSTSLRTLADLGPSTIIMEPQMDTAQLLKLQMANGGWQKRWQ